MPVEMGSLCGIHHSHLLFSPRPHPSHFSRSTSLLSIKSSSSSQNPQPITAHRSRTLSDTLHIILKPIFVTLTAAAAAASISARHHNPSSYLSHAASSPSSTPQSEAAEKEQIVEESVRTSSDEVDILQAQIEAKIKDGKLPEAITIMDRLIFLQPEDKDFLLLKAHLHAHAGNTDAARAVFEDVLEKEPLTVEAYHGLVTIVTQKNEEASNGEDELDSVMERIEVAMETCKRENRKEELRDFMLLVAQVRVMEGEYDEALGVCRELVVEEPRDFRPYLCQGIIYTLLRKKDEAEKQFEKYRRLVPEGHPYAQFFKENMALMKAFGEKHGSKRSGVLKS